MSNAEHCICCGQIIPEGMQVCLMCGMKVNKKQRQVDRIRNMSIEEMAGFLQHSHFNAYFLDEIIQYLESEVDTE